MGRLPAGKRLFARRQTIVWLRANIATEHRLPLKELSIALQRNFDCSSTEHRLLFNGASVAALKGIQKSPKIGQKSTWCVYFCPIFGDFCFSVRLTPDAGFAYSGL
jgi:hypothetical protein